MTRQFEHLAVLLGVLGFVGCGDSSSTPFMDASTADVSTDTGSKHEASGGGSNQDAGGMTQMMTVQCGTMMCSPPMSALGGLGGGGGGGMGGMAGGLGGAFSFSACCLSDGGCGASLGGGLPGGGGGDGGASCLDTSAGTPDPSCPSQSIIGFALTGCCSNAGICGNDLSIVGLGCNSLSGLGGGLLMMGDSGPPRTCGGDGGTTTGEAGVSDAGDAGADAGAGDSATDSGGQDATHD